MKGVVIAVPVALGCCFLALVAFAAMNPFSGWREIFTRNLNFQESLQEAAAKIREVEERVAREPALRAKVRHCTPPFSAGQGACLLEDQNEDILTVDAVTGFLRPRGWYLYKRWGAPAPEVHEPDVDLELARRNRAKVPVGGGFWLEYWDD